VRRWPGFAHSCSAVSSLLTYVRGIVHRKTSWLYPLNWRRSKLRRRMSAPAALVVALDDDAHVPEPINKSTSSVLRRALRTTSSQPVAKSFPGLPPPSYYPERRPVRWTLNGEELDGFGSVGVRAALDLASVVYIALGAATLEGLSDRAKRSLYEFVMALKDVSQVFRNRVFLLFPPIHGRVPEPTALTELAALAGAVGYVDGVVASLAFQALADSESSKFFHAAASATSDSLRASVAAYRNLRDASDTAPLPVPDLSSANDTPPDCFACVWSGSLLVESHLYHGFELVEWLTRDDSYREASSCPTIETAKVVGVMMDPNVPLGALVGLASTLELRLSANFENVACGINQQELHNSAFFCLGWREGRMAALVKLGCMHLLCSWRRVRLPVKDEYSWVCVAKPVDMRTIEGSVLDVATFRRSTLGLEGRTTIYSAEALLEKLPKLRLERNDDSKLGRLRLVCAEDVNCEASDGLDPTKPASHVPGPAPLNAVGKSAKTICSILRGKPPRKSDISAPERRILAGWDFEATRKRKWDRSGIDDAIIVGQGHPTKLSKSFAVPDPAKRNGWNGGEEVDPAVIALRNRRSHFPTGPQVAAPFSRREPPRGSSQSSRVTPSRHPSSGPRSLPQRHGHVTPSSRLAVCSQRCDPSPGDWGLSSKQSPSVDQMREPSSLSSFLGDLKILAESDPPERDCYVSANVFSVGTSTNVRGWREPENAAQARSELESPCPGGGRASVVLEHGVDSCAESLCFPDAVEGAIQSFERGNFMSGRDHKSAFGMLPEAAAAVQKLQKEARALSKLPSSFAGPRPKVRELSPRTECPDITVLAEALVPFVLRNKQRLFTETQQRWLPNLLRSNCARFHLPMPLLSDPNLTSHVVTLQLLKGRPDTTDDSIHDGLFLLLFRWIETRRTVPALNFSKD
jgi:hypothetical protein